ncbi:MAG: hypothetical protein N4A54_12195 [Peptostreptococcaceae bacterium]|jgi:hypothetical protein|nr:hypothetical protein [Peptostreptococcaceae bacterium]
MNKTSFLELNKPEYKDMADINLLNQNLDRIDQEFKNINNNFYEQDDINITVKPNSIVSFDSKISTKINPTIKGKFMQNLIDTNKCIYRVNGDTKSPLPKNITDNSMLVMSYSSNFIGTGCFIGLKAGIEYTIKGDSLADSYIIVYDANNLTTSNYSTKRITSVLKSKHHNFKFIAPSSGYVFIGFSKTGSDKTGTIISNLLCMEGDYVNRDMEWFKGVKPSDVNIKSVGKNLFDNEWDLEDKGLTLTQKSKTEFVIKGIGNQNFDKNLFPNIKFKPNTQYTFSGECNEDLDKNTTLLIGYTDGSSDNIYTPKTTSSLQPFLSISKSGKTIEKIYYSYSSAGGSTTIKDFMIEEGINKTEYEEPKKSILEMDDWIGDGDQYNNGLLTKSWGRIKLSEAYDDILGNILTTLSNVYRFRFRLKKSYSGYASTPTNYIKMYFKDFAWIVDVNLNAKHTYIANTEIGYDQMDLFIPKTEIDNLSGNNLNEKFMNWIKENDDYIYYQKANSIAYKASGFDDLVSYFGQTNIINNCNSNIDLTIQQNLCHENNKSSYISVPIKKKNIKINIFDWKENNGIFTTDIYDNDITDLKMVDISFDLAKDFKTVKDISKHTQSFDGFVRLYATKLIQKELYVNLLIN